MRLKIGEAALRLEVERFLVGNGCYTDDKDACKGLRVTSLRTPRLTFF